MNNFTLPPPPPPPPKATSEADSARHQGSVGRANRGYARGRGRGANFRGAPRDGGFRGSHQHNRSYQSSRGGFPSNATSQSRGADFTGTTWDSPLTNTPGITAAKRKRDGCDQQSGRSQNAFQINSKPVSKPKVEVAPAVPSFGFSLPLATASPAIRETSTPALPNHKSETVRAKKKSNQLGLTPQGDELEESEEEVVDEEAVLATYSGPLRVEYNGVVTDLGSAEALKQWIEERKRRWPTKARIEESKKKALKEKQDTLRRRLEADMARKKELEARTKARDEQSRKERDEKKEAKDRKALEKHLAKANKLRRRLGIGASDSAALPPATPKLISDAPGANEAEDARTRLSTEPPATSGQDETIGLIEAESSLGLQPTSSEEESDDDSDSSSDSSTETDSDSSTNAPEETSSKADGPVRVLAPNRESNRRICQNFALRGRCGRGDRCHFKHDVGGRAFQAKPDMQKQPVPAKRKTLHQRLVEQEQEVENRLALQAIKYLGQNGLFDNNNA